MRIRNSWAAILIAAQLAACTAIPAGQGIRGIVLLGPNCPVEQEGVPCPDTPYQTDLVVTSADGEREIKTFSSAEDGSFEIALPVGGYAIRSLQGAMLPYCSTNEAVIVSVGNMTEIIVFCDSGIR